MESSRYLFATSDFRNQNKHEKAAELHFITGCTYEEAGEAFGVSKAAVFRARKALEKGRDAGKNGRPNRMSAEIMELYMEKVEFWLDLYEEITYAKAIEMAGDVFKSNINNFADGIPTFDYKWVKKTFADHNISMRSPRPVETERLLSRSTIIESIQNLEEIIKSKNIPPELMINGDETQVRTLTSRRKVASRNGTGQPVTEEHPEDEHVTLLLLVTASGHHFKPLLIFPLKTVPPLDKRIIAAFRITGSDNGWIDKKIMQNYVENIFLEELEEYRKNLKMGDQWAILILDNHSSRNSLTNCVLFEAHKLVIFFLPPHSSAVMQPLDLGPNLRIKRVFSNLYIPNAKEDRPARRNSKLIALLRAISEGCCANIILSGWEKAGLYPINPATVLGSKMVRPDNIQELREIGRKRGPHMDGGKILSNGVIVHPSSSTEKENQPPKKQRVKNTNKEKALNVLN